MRYCFEYCIPGKLLANLLYYRAILKFYGFLLLLWAMIVTDLLWIVWNVSCLDILLKYIALICEKKNGNIYPLPSTSFCFPFYCSILAALQHTAGKHCASYTSNQKFKFTWKFSWFIDILLTKKHYSCKFLCLHQKM